MAECQNFRSAFNGFNREDVVHYIEYMNNKHNAQINQLKSEMQAMQSELSQLRLAPTQGCELSQQLEEAQTKCAALEQELAEVRAQLAQTLTHQETAVSRTEEELEAYRRAERAERLAQERAARLSAQANGILADATVKVEEASTQMAGAADQVIAQMRQLQAAIIGSKSSLQEAAAALYALQPDSSEE